MSDKVIVITGANGGLGRALAQRFAADGEKVVLLGRSLEKVQEVASSIGANAMAVACEVTLGRPLPKLPRFTQRSMC
jgi:NADP-dependent 3-hydroxy acid dehydrogenase YdfG